MADRGKPQGRDEVMAAVRAATADLLAACGPRDVSVREIADRAGVNHALVHRHFGSKQDLLRRVIGEQSAEIATAARALPRHDVTTVLELLDRYPAYWRILARTALDAPELLPADEFRAARTFLELLGQQAGGDHRAVAAVTGALVLGWKVFGRHLAAAVGEPDEARLNAAVADALKRLL